MPAPRVVSASEVKRRRSRRTSAIEATGCGGLRRPRIKSRGSLFRENVLLWHSFKEVNISLVAKLHEAYREVFHDVIELRSSLAVVAGELPHQNSLKAVRSFTFLT